MVEDALSASSLKYIVIDVSAATYLGHGTISGRNPDKQNCLKTLFAKWLRPWRWEAAVREHPWP